jgi:hypothetical protein
VRTIFREIQALMSFDLNLLRRRFRRCSKIISPEFKSGCRLECRATNTRTHEMQQDQVIISAEHADQNDTE